MFQLVDNSMKFYHENLGSGVGLGDRLVSLLKAASSNSSSLAVDVGFYVTFAVKIE